MTLCVQSQHELDDLQSWVSDSFGSVPNNGMAREEFGHLSDPYGGDNFRKIYKMVPVKNVYRVDLNWALPCLMDKYECKPLHYLSWIIGHEGRKDLSKTTADN